MIERDRRHPGTGHDRAGTALEVRERLGKLIARRIAGARVVIFAALLTEASNAKFDVR